jgi:hypothetical protein
MFECDQQIEIEVSQFAHSCAPSKRQSRPAARFWLMKAGFRFLPLLWSTFAGEGEAGGRPASSGIPKSLRRRRGVPPIEESTSPVCVGLTLPVGARRRRSTPAHSRETSVLHAAQESSLVAALEL